MAAGPPETSQPGSEPNAILTGGGRLSSRAPERRFGGRSIAGGVQEQTEVESASSYLRVGRVQLLFAVGKGLFEERPEGCGICRRGDLTIACDGRRDLFRERARRNQKGAAGGVNSDPVVGELQLGTDRGVA